MFSLFILMALREILNLKQLQQRNANLRGQEELLFRIVTAPSPQTIEF